MTMAKLGLYCQITVTIARDLFDPESPIRRRRNAPGAIVAMPKAAVHKDDGSSGTKHDVGLTWQIIRMQAIAKTSRMQTPSH